MKPKKILAILTAAAINIGAMAINAAAITNGNGADWDEQGNKYIFDVKKEAGGNYTDITGVIIGITITDVSDGFGGGVAYVSGFPDGDWPGFVEWGNDEAGKTIVSNGRTIEYRSDTPIFTENSSGVIVMVEQWWGGDMTVDSISFERGGVLDTTTTATISIEEDFEYDDSIIAVSEVADVNIGAVEGTDSAPTGNTAVVLIVTVMAVAGVTAVATKKRK